MEAIRGVRLRKFKLRKIILGVRMHFRHKNLLACVLCIMMMMMMMMCQYCTISSDSITSTPLFLQRYRSSLKTDPVRLEISHTKDNNTSSHSAILIRSFCRSFIESDIYDVG